MFGRHTFIAVSAAVALGLPAAAGAQEIGFTYLEGGFIATFVNDVEDSGTITGTGSTLELETDAGGGGVIGGAWEFSDNLHLFGEYSSASQDLEVSEGSATVEGDFNVQRWRLGVGYASPASSSLRYYGRLSFDRAEIGDVDVAGYNLDADADESGIGGEVGAIWAATSTFHLQGHARYTAVGEVAGGNADTFDSDILLGLSGRWYFRPDLALVTGYEYGKITTFNAGVRFSF